MIWLQRTKADRSVPLEQGFSEPFQRHVRDCCGCGGRPRGIALCLIRDFEKARRIEINDNHNETGTVESKCIIMDAQSPRSVSERRC